MTVAKADTLARVVLRRASAAVPLPRHADQHVAGLHRSGHHGSGQHSAEQRSAADDLQQEDGLFALPGAPGPYILHLSRQAGRLQLDVCDCDERRLRLLVVSLRPLLRIITEYRQLIEAFEDALVGPDAERIKTIDMGRRGLHDEGARLLIDRLAGKVRLDFETARRLFALIALL